MNLFRLHNQLTLKMILYNILLRNTPFPKKKRFVNRAKKVIDSGLKGNRSSCKKFLAEQRYLWKNTFLTYLTFYQKIIFLNATCANNLTTII